MPTAWLGFLDARQTSCCLAVKMIFCLKLTCLFFFCATFTEAFPHSPDVPDTKSNEVTQQERTSHLEGQTFDEWMRNEKLSKSRIDERSSPVEDDDDDRSLMAKQCVGIAGACTMSSECCGYPSIVCVLYLSGSSWTTLCAPRYFLQQANDQANLQILN